MDKEKKGLKKLRRNYGPDMADKPSHYCENCKCSRYSSCDCDLKKKK